MRSRVGLHPFQIAGARFLAERRFAILADDPGLGRSTQAIAALRELDVGALVLVPTVGARNVWEAELAATPGLALDRSRTGILPSAGAVRVLTWHELLRRRLSPRAAPRLAHVLVVDEAALPLTYAPRLATKIRRLADAFVRADGGVWILVDPTQVEKDRFLELLQTVGLLLRRRRASPVGGR